MQQEVVVGGKEASIDDALFCRVEKFDWAEEVEEAMEMDGLETFDHECLSKILLENSPRKIPSIPRLERTNSARKGRRGRGGGRKPAADQPDAHGTNNRNGKRQPSQKSPRQASGKPAKNTTNGDSRGAGNTPTKSDRPPQRPGSGRTQPKGEPKSARGQHGRRERCNSVNDSRTIHPLDILTSPRYYSGSLSARASRADRSSDWNADKLSNSGGDTHRSTNSCGRGPPTGHHPSNMGSAKRAGARGLPRTPRRNGNSADRQNSRTEQWVKANGYQSFEGHGAGKGRRDDSSGSGRRWTGEKPRRREPFGTHNR